MNKREAASLVAILAAAFPQRPVAKETVAIYADALADLEYDTTLEAIRGLVLTEDFMPTIASIRKRVGRANGMLAPTPIKAWGEVSGQAERVGRGGIPEWSHESIAEAVRSIGWWNLCQSSNPETLRSQFLRLYEDARKESDNTSLTERGWLNGSKEGNLLTAREPLASALTETTGNREQDD